MYDTSTFLLLCLSTGGNIWIFIVFDYFDVYIIWIKIHSMLLLCRRFATRSMIFCIFCCLIVRATGLSSSQVPHLLELSHNSRCASASVGIFNIETIAFPSDTDNVFAALRFLLLCCLIPYLAYLSCEAGCL